jgi:hypothetical protein
MNQRTNAGWTFMSITNLHQDGLPSIEARDKAWRKGRIVGSRTSPIMRPSLDRALMVEGINQLVLTYNIQPQDVTAAFTTAAKILGRTS